MLRQFIPVTIFLLGAFAAKSQSTPDMKWMAGSWKMNVRGGQITENWTITNDSTLKGSSYFIPEGKDSILQETITLNYRGGQWLYIPVVAHQNNGNPVVFRVIYAGQEEWIAENPAHDFPQRIAYRRIGPSIYASIEGRKDGRYRKQNFNFSSR